MSNTLKSTAAWLAVAACLALAVLCTSARAAETTSPLVTAATNGDADTVKGLLAAGADPDSHDDSGLTALNWAAFNGHLGVVQMLLASHAAVDSQGNTWGYTPLMNAAYAGHDDVIAALLAAGAAVNATDANGNQPIQWAAHGQNTQTVSLLRARGATADIAPIVAVQALCDAAKEPLGEDKMDWGYYANEPNHAGCSGVKHDFGGSAGAVTMYTYAVDGDETGARSLSIIVHIADRELPKGVISATLQPLLRNIFAATQRGAVPGALSDSAAQLTDIQTDTALGHVTASFKLGDDPKYPTIGAEYRMAVDLK